MRTGHRYRPRPCPRPRRPLHRKCAESSRAGLTPRDRTVTIRACECAADNARRRRNGRAVDSFDSTRPIAVDALLHVYVDRFTVNRVASCSHRIGGPHRGVTSWWSGVEWSGGYRQVESSRVESSRVESRREKSRLRRPCRDEIECSGRRTGGNLMVSRATTPDCTIVRIKRHSIPPPHRRSTCRFAPRRGDSTPPIRSTWEFHRCGAVAFVVVACATMCHCRRLRAAAVRS
jgi:hypothetical protein